MEDQSSTCDVCGCALSPKETVCPFCGTSVAPVAFQSGTTALVGQESANVPIRPRQRIVLEDRRQPVSVCGDAGGAHAVRSRKRSPLAIAAAVAGALAFAGLGIAVFGAWNGDQDLKRQADQALDNQAGDQGKLVETRPEFASGSGNSAGALAGGGIVVPDNDALYIGLSSGIGYQDSVSASEEETFPLVSSDCALYLNLYDDALYYVAQAGSSVEDAFRGASIRKVENLRNVIGSSSGSEVLYRASEGEAIVSLTVQNGWMYFLISKDETYSLMEMPCNGSSKPREIDRREAESAWAFAENGQVYVLSTTASDWRLDAKKLADERSSFKTCMEGAGRLAVGCLHEGALYYALEEGAGSSHLCRKTEQGEFDEYEEVADAVRLSASGNVVAAVSHQGGLFWIDASTGISHDISAAAEYFLNGSDPRKLGLSAYDEWICVRDDKNGMIQYNVNSNQMWTYGSSAAESKDGAGGQGRPSDPSSETIMA